MRGVGRAVSTFISGNANFPVVVELVDKKENLEKILPFLEKNATHALVVMGEVDYLVTDFMRRRQRDTRISETARRSQATCASSRNNSNKLINRS